METNDVRKETGGVIYTTDRVNLYDFGYEKSGHMKGDPDVFSSYLNRILNGDLVDNHYNGISDDEKKERMREVRELEGQLRRKEGENAAVQEEIKNKEKDIDKYKKDLLQIRERRSRDKEKLKSESFSPFRFSLNLFLLLMLSVYLFFFYVSAAYKALYVDFEGIAESIANGEGTGSIMPGAYDLMNALQYNYLLFVVPFVFYGFGWAFHVALELKHNVKYLFLSLLVSVTFAVDFLLAMIINNNTENAKELMGLAVTPWGQSPSFYIILFLGFLVYIIWSVLLDSLLREWDKKEITNNLRKIIRHLQGDVKVLNERIADVNPILRRIADNREDVHTLMHGNLKKYVDQFSSGWIAYLAPSNMKDMKAKCLFLKKEFEDQHNIRSGVVKVTTKRAFPFFS